MEVFIDYILQFGNLNKQQIDLIVGKASTLTLHKDDYYWEAGKRVNQVGFLTGGLFGYITTTIKARKSPATLSTKIT